jgi:hypothetical protein
MVYVSCFGTRGLVTWTSSVNRCASVCRGRVHPVDSLEEACESLRDEPPEHGRIHSDTVGLPLVANKETDAGKALSKCMIVP